MITTICVHANTLQADGCQSTSRPLSHISDDDTRYNEGRRLRETELPFDVSES